MKWLLSTSQARAVEKWEGTGWGRRDALAPDHFLEQKKNFFSPKIFTYK